MAPFNLSQILEPSSAQEFMEATWGKRYRHFPGQPGKFAALLPWSRFNSLLEEHCFDPVRAHLVMERSLVPPRTYRCRDIDGRPKPHLDPVKVNKPLSEGATLLAKGVEETGEPARVLA